MIKKLRRRIILINMLFVGTVILSIFIAVICSNYANSVNMMERGMNQVLDKQGKLFDDRREPLPEDFFGGENTLLAPENNTQTATAGTDSQPQASAPAGTPSEPSAEPTAPVENGQPKKDFHDFHHQFGDETPIEISSYVIVKTGANGAILDTTENDLSIDSDVLTACVQKALQSGSDFGQLDEYGLMFAVRTDAYRSRVVFARNSSIYTSLINSIIISLLLFLGSMAVIFGISLILSGLAVKPVQKAWEQQKQFVADASHELKTPLTVILANNNIMLSHQSSTVAEERQWLESTEEEASHMKNLIDNMLFLAKSDAGTAKLQLCEVNFSEIVEGCALNFEPVAFEKEVLIDADGIAEDVLLQGDPTQLNQLAHILTDNAVKYASPGTTVTIQLQNTGDRAEFSVNNRGNVIAKDEMEHIFDRFYRAEKSRTTKGYGLGLSIAQRIVESMNGKITVESNDADGTTFTVRFPRSTK